MCTSLIMLCIPGLTHPTTGGTTLFTFVTNACTVFTAVVGVRLLCYIRSEVSRRKGTSTCAHSTASDGSRKMGVEVPSPDTHLLCFALLVAGPCTERRPSWGYSCGFWSHRKCPPFWSHRVSPCRRHEHQPCLTYARIERTYMSCHTGVEQASSRNIRALVRVQV